MTTHYTDPETGITLATVRKQGPWRVRLYYGPERGESYYRECATEAAAKHYAARHAAKFA